MPASYPVWIHLGSLRVHPHWIFEALAYSIGFRLYLYRRRRSGDFLPWLDRAWLVAGAIAGAAIGSKVLYWLEDPFATAARWNDIVYMMGGKTIVGGLAGGLIGVEWVKKQKGITRRTGDLFAIPLAAGIAIGRIGCFLSGLGDQTYGTATSLPWGIDFGDGIARHPVQLYEAGFLVLLAAVLFAMEGGPLGPQSAAGLAVDAAVQPKRVPRRGPGEGWVFRVFLVSYMAFRFLVDFWKPGVPILGLTSLQWCAAAVVLYYLPSLFSMSQQKEVPAHG